MSTERVNKAYKKYLKSFDYDGDMLAYKRGGRMGFGRKYELGSYMTQAFNNKFNNVVEEAVEEPELEALIEAFKSDNPNSGPWASGGNSGLTTNQALGVVGTAAGILGDGLMTSERIGDKRRAVLDDIRGFNQGYYNGITDNTALLNAASNITYAKGRQASDFRNRSWLGDIGSALGSGVSTAINTGGNVLAGLAMGAFDIGKSAFNRWEAKKAAEATQRAARQRNKELGLELMGATDRVDDYNDAMRMYRYYNNPFEYALGGEMRSHGSDWSNGLSFIDEGGRHEENPYEGVPSGIDENGVPNLVEEGEVIWNNEYVFSDRLKLPEELAKKYALGGDLTFADALTKVTKEAQPRPNDPISNETTRAIVNEFMDAQEAVRKKEQQRAARELQRAYDEDFMEQVAIMQPAQMQASQEGINYEMPIIEQEGMPVGFAFGGNKFDTGSWKLNADGTYTSPSGKVYSSLEEARASINYATEVDFPLEASIVTAERVRDASQRTKQPILRKVVGTTVTGQPRYKYVVGDKEFYSLDEAVKHRDSTVFKNAAGKFQTSNGEIYDNENRANTRQYQINRAAKRIVKQNNKQKAQNQTAQTSQAAAASVQASMPISTTQSSNTQYPAAPVREERTQANAGTTPSGGTTQPAAYSAAQTPATQGTPRAKGTKTGSVTGGTGRVVTPNGYTINYDRRINGKDFEARDSYKNFIDWMRANSNSEEAKKWIGHIQDEITKSGSKYKFDSKDPYADWLRLATDEKVGPVHQITDRIAKTWAAQNVKAPDVELNSFEAPKIPEEELNAAIEAAIAQDPNNPQQPAAPQFNYKDTWQRYAPVVGSGAMALYGMLGEPNYVNADAIISAARQVGVPVNIPVDTIGDYMTFKPFDERYLVNMANQNRAAAARGIVNTSNGNRGMDLLANMSLAHSNQQELGEIMRQAYLANQTERARVAEFNRGTNIQNMNALNARNTTQAQLNSQRQGMMLNGLERGYAMRQNIKDTWDAATMESLNSLLTSLGAIGKENEQSNILMSMAEQGYFPVYDSGKGILQWVPQPTSAKKGGKLNKKKRRF